MKLKEKIPDKKELGRREFAVLGFLVFLAAGFVVAGVINFVLPTSQFCSLMGCLCEDVEMDNGAEGAERTPIDGEIECNTCGSTEFKYHIGLFWVSQNCESTEIIMCEDGQPTDQYYRDEGCGDYNFGNIFTSDVTREIMRSL